MTILCRTTWIGEIMARERGIDPPVEEATRAGDLAMLFYSIGVYFSHSSDKRLTFQVNQWRFLRVLFYRG